MGNFLFGYAKVARSPIHRIARFSHRPAMMPPMLCETGKIHIILTAQGWRGE
jgi:hypothetical protein